MRRLQMRQGPDCSVSDGMATRPPQRQLFTQLEPGGARRAVFQFECQTFRWPTPTPLQDFEAHAIQCFRRMQTDAQFRHRLSLRGILRTKEHGKRRSASRGKFEPADIFAGEFCFIEPREYCAARTGLERLFDGPQRIRMGFGMHEQHFVDIDTEFGQRRGIRDLWGIDPRDPALFLHAERGERRTEQTQFADAHLRGQKFDEARFGPAAIGKQRIEFGISGIYRFGIGFNTTRAP
jgi:hypothetical protein